MRAQSPRADEAIYYPESDGKPMAETDVHRDLMMALIYALQMFFQGDPKVYVSGNLLIYYVQGDPRRSVSPDVFVVRGVPKKPRRTYRIWQEGRAPDVAIELTSKSTLLEDLHKKANLYAKLGVKEYFLYDPLREYLDGPLTALTLDEEGSYRPVPVNEGRVRSEVLGLDLVDTGETLKLYDPAGQRFLLTPQEAEAAWAQAEAARARAEAARAQAEKEKRVEADARRQAEAELARLRAELGPRRRRKGR